LNALPIFSGLFRRRSTPTPAPTLRLSTATVALRIVRSERARRYLLRLDDDGAARLVIPRRGSQAEAMRFLERSRGWLERRHRQWQARRAAQPSWQDGSSILFRGEPVILRVAGDLFGTVITFADQTIRTAAAPDHRAAIQAHLRELAEQELPVRTRELAREHGIEIRRILIRAQKTRWGSCSATGTISLNWRLIHAPPFVQDYLIIHELMHRRQMNHSARYWKLVADAFPRWQEAEAWLKKTRIDMLA
jgi:predicted metal-dependent hydrolase